MRLVVSVFLLCLLSFSVVTAQSANPCLQSEKMKEFDFWVGNWDVYVKGKKVGENLVEKGSGRLHIGGELEECSRRNRKKPQCVRCFCKEMEAILCRQPGWSLDVRGEPKWKDNGIYRRNSRRQYRGEAFPHSRVS